MSLRPRETAAVMEIHPAAEFFPTMTDSAFESFKADITANGLLEAIWLFEGKILDGRNRYRACCELGITPQFRNYEGTSPVAFAWSLNGERRHLTHGQRAAIGVEMLPALQAEAHERQLAGLKRGTQPPVPSELRERGRPKMDAVEAAAAIVGASATNIGYAKGIKAHDPATFERLKSGEITVGAAHRMMKGIPPKPRPPGSKPRAVRVEEIRALAHAGHRMAQIAQKLGIGESHVGRIATAGGITLPDHALGHTHRIDARRVIEESVSTLEGLALGLRTINGARFNVSPDELQEWLKSIDESLRVISRVRTYLRKQAQ